MARIRTIKPEFWTDETLGECSPIARLLFVAALNFADDNGNLERSARQLKAQAFPYDSIDCEPLVLEMIRAGLFIEYHVADRKYLHIKGFLTHQRIDRPSKCRIPLYEESMRTHIPLVEPSSSPRPVRESKGVESKGRESNGVSIPSESQSAAADPVRQVFDHWRQVFNHPSAALDPKRTATIKRALKGYTAADLCESISGYLNSGHHMGQNDRNTVYDGLHLLLRDADHIDAGLRFARAPPELSSKLTQHNVSVLQDWKPPELRNETARYPEISGSDGDVERDVRQRTLTANH